MQWLKKLFRRREKRILAANKPHPIQSSGDTIGTTDAVNELLKDIQHMQGKGNFSLRDAPTACHISTFDHFYLDAEDQVLVITDGSVRTKAEDAKGKQLLFESATFILVLQQPEPPLVNWTVRSISVDSGDDKQIDYKRYWHARGVILDLIYSSNALRS